MGDNKADVTGLTQAVAQPNRGQHAAIADIMVEQFNRDSLPPISPNSEGAYEL